MNITIICVGKLKEKFWKQACDEYLKRLRPYANVSVCEVTDVDPRTSGGEDIAREREGEAIVRAIEKRFGAGAGSRLKAGGGGASRVATTRNSGTRSVPRQSVNANVSSNSGSRSRSNVKGNVKARSNICSPSAHIFLLAIEGQQRTSLEFSQHLDDLKLDGISDFAFIIGGSGGVSSAVYESASELVSFGKITLPHNLARVVLLEQIYRAFKISRGEPYHK